VAGDEESLAFLVCNVSLRALWSHASALKLLVCYDNAYAH